MNYSLLKAINFNSLRVIQVFLSLGYSKSFLPLEAAIGKNSSKSERWMLKK